MNKFYKPLLFTIISFSIFITGCSSTSPDRGWHADRHTDRHKDSNINKFSTTTSEVGYKQYENLWDEMANNLHLGDDYAQKFDKYTQFYLKRPRHLEQVSIRAEPYMYFILNEIKKRQMPYELAVIPIVESAFNISAKSRMGAVGVWQIMPSTGHMLGLDYNWWYNGKKDIYQSTNAALNYLQKQYERNNNDWLLAFASYNAGFGNVLNAKRRYLRSNPGGNADYWAIRKYLPKETQSYIPKILAIAHLIEYQQKYNTRLTPIKNQPVFTAININQQLDLNKIANSTPTNIATIKALNPGFIRNATPKGKHILLLPIKSATIFQQKLANNPHAFKNIALNKAQKTEKNQVTHTIKPGDNLGRIAQKYNSSIVAIKRANNLKGSRIIAGRKLVIPTSSNPSKTSAKNPSNTRTLIHTVKRGDTLWGIAREHKVSTRNISDWNNVDITKPLKKGTKLNIKVKKTRKKIAYTLRSGDNLTRIANRFSVRISDITKWNKINRSKILHPGNVLYIWVKR